MQNDNYPAQAKKLLTLILLLISWFFAIEVFRSGYGLYTGSIRDEKLKFGLVFFTAAGYLPTTISFLIGLFFRKHLPTLYWALTLPPLPLLLLGSELVRYS